MEERTKFFNAYPNKAIRERAEQLELNSPALARKINRIMLERDPEAKTITAETVRQWTCGYMQPRYERIPDLMQALGCSLYYLFGMEDVPNADAQRIQAVTGLSASSVDFLSGYPMIFARELMAHFIDAVIGSGRLLALSLAYYEWEQRRGKQTEIESLRAQADRILENATGTMREVSKKIEANADIYDKLRETEESIDVGRYRMELEFHRFLDSIEQGNNHGKH